MSFETTAIANAEACGINNAYFCNGTMFFDADDVVIDCIDCIDAFRLIYPNTVASYAGDEVAIDFVA